MAHSERKPVLRSTPNCYGALHYTELLSDRQHRTVKLLIASWNKPLPDGMARDEQVIYAAKST